MFTGIIFIGVPGYTAQAISNIGHPHPPADPEARPTGSDRLIQPARGSSLPVYR